MRSINILASPRALCLALLASLGAVLLLAACTGGGEDSSDAGSTPPAQETQAPAEAATPEETAEPTEVAGDASGAEIDPCSLLTKDEVEAAVGNPVEEGVFDLGGCDWDSAPEDSDAHLALIPVLDVSMCTQARAEGSKDVSGLGVEAWWEFSESPPPGGDVIACPEGWLVQLGLVGGVTTGAEEAPLRAAGEELMAKVLERM